MTKQKLTIFALLAVAAVSVPMAIAPSIPMAITSTTFFGEDCTAFNHEFNIKACNDLNNLNDRVMILEGNVTALDDRITALEPPVDECTEGEECSLCGPGTIYDPETNSCVLD